MRRRVLAVALALALLAPASGSAGEATRAEALVGSAVGYVAGGLPPVLLAVLGASCGWTVPVVIAFAVGGAAYSLFDTPEGPRAERVPPLLRATSGAVRGTVLFPAMMGKAGKKVWGPYLAKALHHWRARS